MKNNASVRVIGYKQRRIRENLTGLSFLFPSLFGFVAFVFLPMLFSLLLSFSEWSVISGFKGIKFIGLDNFKVMLTDLKFRIAMINTFRYTFLVVPISIMLGFLVAVIIHDYAYFKDYLKIAIFLPYISSLVAITLVWQVLLNPTRGPVNMFLMAIGIENPPGWFASTRWAIVAVAFESIWMQIGYNVVLYMAAFTGINTDLYDAASIDGCGGFRRVLHVTIPGVTTTTFFLFIMAVISSFKVFDQISVLSPGNYAQDGFLVIAYQIYLQAFQFYKMGYASALSWVLFFVILIFTMIQWKFDKS